jgi:outer membrane protein insertion porin family
MERPHGLATYMKLIRSYALLSLLLSSATSPLLSVELYDDKKVSNIEIVVDSPDGIDGNIVRSKLKTKEGSPFSQLTFDSDLKTLSDEYERVEPTVQVKDGQVSIVIHVVPRAVIHQIRWEGNNQFKTSTLQKELDIKPNTIFKRQEFTKAFNKVKEYYFKKGYFEAQLTYSIQPLENNQVDIVIDVYEGRPGHIKEIELNGFTPAETSDILEQIYLKKHNFMTSWLTGSGIFREEALEQDRMTIMNYLHNKGYADARVTIELAEDPENRKLIVEITAHRGQLYHFGSISFEGGHLFTAEEIAKKSLIKQGDVYSPEKIRETAQAIKDAYGHKGYIDTSVQYETDVKEDAPLFDVQFTIDEGKPYKIGLIHIIGNSSTQSNVILRESLLVPGETFDSRKLKATQTRLEAIGYFKSVNVYAVRSADDANFGDNYRDVYIEVEETTTGNFSVFTGFSSMENVFGGLDLTERNFRIAGLAKALTGRPSSLRGAGEYFHARSTIGKKQNNILVSWMNPYVDDTLWRLGTEISKTFSELQENIVVTTYGGSVTASYPLSSFWTVGMRQRLRHSKDHLELTPVDGSDIASKSVEAVRKELDQDGLISAFSGNLSYDSTDSAYKPHRGWRSYFEAEMAGIGGDYRFFKFKYENSIYFPITQKGTLKFRGDAKYIVPFSGTSRTKIPYSERFLLGGENTVRGFRPFLLGPVIQLKNGSNQDVPQDTPYGGLSSLLFSLEYNHQIFRMLDVFAFVDAGSVTKGVFTFADFHPTAGVGVRLDIGNGTPIMVGYGLALRESDRASKQVDPLFFSMGGQF